MSKETGLWLNTNTLVGFTDERGNAWHYRAEEQGAESNHYTGAIPVADVQRRLFHWDAVSAPVSATIYAPNGDPITITDETRQVIVRPDTRAILGVFKDSYSIHQYSEWLLDTVAVLIDDDLAIGSAGLLEEGGIAWVQIDLPETIVHKSGEKYRLSLLACTSHNGKLATTFKLVVTRVVCDNTLRCATDENGEAVKVKHSRYSDLKIASTRDALGLMYKGADDFDAEMDRLMATDVSGKQFVQWLDVTVPMPEIDGRTKTMAERKREEYMTLYTNDNRVAPFAGSAWGVLQADNTWRSHFASTHKGTDRGQRNIFAAATGKSFDLDTLALKRLDAVLSGADTQALIVAGV